MAKLAGVVVIFAAMVAFGHAEDVAEAGRGWVYDGSRVGAGWAASGVEIDLGPAVSEGEGRSPQNNLVRMRRNPLVDYLRNGDFEQTDGAGNLVHWSVFREAYVDTDAAMARSGVRSVRSSYLFGLGQHLAVPASPFQTYAIQGYARVELTDEIPSVRSVFYGGNGSYIDEDISLSKYSQSGQYDEFWITQEVPAGAEEVTVYLMGQDASRWPRFDDVRLYTEQFQWLGNLKGEGWTTSTGVEVSGDELFLPDGGSASQRVAAGTENQAYFLTAGYEAPTGADLTIKTEWLPANNADTSLTEPAVQPLPAVSGAVVVDGIRTTATATRGQVRLTLRAGGGTVWLTRLRRGFAKVEPAVLTTGPASPDGPLRLTAAIPEHLTSATMRILRGGVEVEGVTSVTMMGTTARGDWDAGANPSGQYEAEFTLLQEDAPAIVVRREFDVVYEPDATTEVPPVEWNGFMRGAWLFVRSNETTTATLRTLELAKADGFDLLLILCSADKFPVVRQGAELYDFRYMLFDPVITTIFVEYLERTWFSKHDYISRLKTRLASVLDDENFMGVYVRDEPPLAHLPQLEKVNRAVVQDGSLGLPFTTFAWNLTTATLGQLDLPVLMVYDYPFDYTAKPGSQESLLHVVEMVNERARVARQMGRRFWHMPQGYSNPIFSSPYPVVPAMYRAQIGGALLAGAQGIIPFTYTSDGAMQGIRRNDLSPTDALEPFVEYNEILERIGPLLMTLDVPTPDGRAPFPLAVSTANGPEGRYVFALNADGDTTRTLVLALSQQPAGDMDIIAEQPLVVGPEATVELILSPGQLVLFHAGSSEILALDAPPVSEPVWSTINLPVTHEFLVRRDVASAPLPVEEMEFGEDAAAISVSIPFQYGVTLPQVYWLSAGGAVNREAGPAGFPAEVTGKASTDAWFTASQTLGIKMYDKAAGFVAGPVDTFTGYSGGAQDVVKGQGNVWAAMGQTGLRRLEETVDGFVPAEITRTSRGQFVKLFGPFPDGSVTGVLADSGVSNIKPGFVHQNFHMYMPIRGLGWHGDLSAGNMLAVPRHDRGVGIFQLGVNGEPQSHWIMAEETVDARAAAWLTAEVLAVADGERHVRFYRIGGLGQSTLLYTWRPDITGPFYIRSMDAQGTRLAIGLHDGRVMVADVAQIIAGSSAVGDWTLY